MSITPKRVLYTKKTMDRQNEIEKKYKLNFDQKIDFEIWIFLFDESFPDSYHDFKYDFIDLFLDNIELFTPKELKTRIKNKQFLTYEELDKNTLRLKIKEV